MEEDQSTTRREYLRDVGVIATGVTGALAGCSGTGTEPDPSGGSNNTTTGNGGTTSPGGNGEQDIDPEALSQNVSNMRGSETELFPLTTDIVGKGGFVNDIPFEEDFKRERLNRMIEGGDGAINLLFRGTFRRPQNILKRTLEQENDAVMEDISARQEISKQLMQNSDDPYYLDTLDLGYENVQEEMIIGNRQEIIGIPTLVRVATLDPFLNKDNSHSLLENASVPDSASSLLEGNDMNVAADQIAFEQIFSHLENEGPFEYQNLENDVHWFEGRGDFEGDYLGIRNGTNLVINIPGSNYELGEVVVGGIDNEGNGTHLSFNGVEGDVQTAKELFSSLTNLYTDDDSESLGSRNSAAELGDTPTNDSVRSNKDEMRLQIMQNMLDGRAEAPDLTNPEFEELWGENYEEYEGEIPERMTRVGEGLDIVMFTPVTFDFPPFSAIGGVNMQDRRRYGVTEDAEGVYKFAYGPAYEDLEGLLRRQLLYDEDVA